MMFRRLASAFVLWIAFADAVVLPTLSQPIKRRVRRQRRVAYVNPKENGGSMLDKSAGLGEPLNVIISGLSSPEVLTDEGFMLYANAIGFAEECLGLHNGKAQTANLGDGQGDVDEIRVVREQYGDTPLGTCIETLIGGNHFRYWRQLTTGALFLAVSEEEDLTEHHMISPDGYDLGRDHLAEAALGEHEYEGRLYITTVQNVHGLLSPGVEGINHGIPIDGVVKLLTITVRASNSTDS